jgi:hypothetical protein
MMAMVGVIRVGNDMSNIADVKSAAEAKKAPHFICSFKWLKYRLLLGNLGE